MERLGTRLGRRETLDLGFSSTYTMATIPGSKTGKKNLET